MRELKLGIIITALIVTSAINKLHAQNNTFKRFKNNPIITENLLPGKDGDNINGPSLIKAPEWLPNKLGRYYLYFAHHQGNYIRLAYADDLKGPWKVYQPGTLHLTDCKVCNEGLPKNTATPGKVRNPETSVKHIASPDLLVDNTNKQLIMYFHCPIEKGKYKGQYTLRATSKDGIHFTPDTTVLGYSYFRVFQWKGNYYSISRAGQLGRSKDGIAAFEEGPNPFAKLQNKTNYLRHAAVKVKGDTLYVFYSKVGDAPEKILLSRITLNDDWNTWTPSTSIVIAEPQEEYEGLSAPVADSKAGANYGKVRELRDPCFFEENKKWYLLYTVAGESGIAIGELTLTK